MKLNDLFVGLMMVIMAVFGASVKWLNTHSKFERPLFFVEIFSASFFGVVTFSLYMSGWFGSDVSPWFVGACIGVAGLLGGKAVIQARYGILKYIIAPILGLKYEPPKFNRRKSDRDCNNNEEEKE